MATNGVMKIIRHYRVARFKFTGIRDGTAAGQDAASKPQTFNPGSKSERLAVGIGRFWIRFTIRRSASVWSRVLPRK